MGILCLNSVNYILNKMDTKVAVLLYISPEAKKVQVDMSDVLQLLYTVNLEIMIDRAVVDVLA